MDNAVFLKGMGLGASLIMAIGTQNAFVLKQGLLRQHVLACVLVCIACDVVLIAAGVCGMGALISNNPGLLFWIKVAGAVFLLVYGARAARSAWFPGAMDVAAATPPAGRLAVISMALAFSLLNPHLYLDTVVLLGSIGGQQPGPAGPSSFAAGAMMASTLWFAGLGFGARFLVPLFARPLAWRVLDGMIAVVMWAIAISLFY